MDYRLVRTLDAEPQSTIFKMLREYNDVRNGSFLRLRELPENQPVPLNILAYEPNEVLVAGLIAETQFAWLKVSIMVVAEHARGRGIGRRLVELAEQEAKTRACTYAYVDTMSYQAPDFYRKLGYAVAGELRDWDSQGHTKYLFTKRL